MLLAVLPQELLALDSARPLEQIEEVDVGSRVGQQPEPSRVAVVEAHLTDCLDAGQRRERGLDAPLQWVLRHAALALQALPPDVLLDRTGQAVVRHHVEQGPRAAVEHGLDTVHALWPRVLAAGIAVAEPRHDDRARVGLAQMVPPGLYAPDGTADAAVDRTVAAVLPVHQEEEEKQQQRRGGGGVLPQQSHAHRDCHYRVPIRPAAAIATDGAAAGRARS
eukprot:SAG11_NODE_5651_length_1496_cov_1.261274_2_plen_221_part_00